MKKWGFLIGVFILIVFTVGSFVTIGKKTVKERPIIIAKAEDLNLNLYYSGSVQPLHIYPVVSPAEGVVKKLNFHYGAEITKNQLLAEISSAKMKQDYANALTNYIKDKDQYLKSKRTFEATNALYQAEIVDRETYLNDKSQFKISQLAYINSQNSLKDLLESMPDQNQKLEELALKDIEDIQDILAKTPDEFKVYAPFDGILMMPRQSSNIDAAANGTSKVMTEGSEIKKYQTLATIGDMTGIATTIYVSEMDINQIAVGQLVTITHPAFPEMILQGKVIEVGHQARQDTSSSSIASFPVRIIVPSLTAAQHQLVRIGMGLKINMVLHLAGQIKVPLKAIFEKNGQALVNVWDPFTKKSHPVAVKTGITSLSDVTILEGIKPGDRIIVER